MARAGRERSIRSFGPPLTGIQPCQHRNRTALVLGSEKTPMVERQMRRSSPMTNPYGGRAAPLSGPATDLLPITPDDFSDLPAAALALYVESGGVLVIDTVSGDASRTVTVADRALLPVAVRRVRLTGTTASGLHALVVR